MSITDGSTSYMITGLEEDSSYSITVEAMNSIGMATSNTATGMTQEAGMSVCKMIVNKLFNYMYLQVHVCFLCRSFQLHLLLPHQLMCPVPLTASLSSGRQWTASTAMET